MSKADTRKMTVAHIRVTAWSEPIKVDSVDQKMAHRASRGEVP